MGLTQKLEAIGTSPQSWALLIASFNGLFSNETDWAKVAKAQNKTLEGEIALLVLHGVLHILGYDHAEPNEKAVMKKREKQLLSELYLSWAK